MLFVAIIGVLVGCYATWLQPLGAPNVTDTDLTTPFTLTGFALALLLVFRTNSSYDRSAQAAAHIACIVAPDPWCCTKDLDVNCNQSKCTSSTFHEQQVCLGLLQVVGSKEDVGTDAQYNKEPSQTGA